jgi:hypothetical protein
VPIRLPDGSVAPNVRIEDMGYKIGCNGMLCIVICIEAWASARGEARFPGTILFWDAGCWENDCSRSYPGLEYIDGNRVADGRRIEKFH